MNQLKKLVVEPKEDDSNKVLAEILKQLFIRQQELDKKLAALLIKSVGE